MFVINDTGKYTTQAAASVHVSFTRASAKSETGTGVAASTIINLAKLYMFILSYAILILT